MRTANKNELGNQQLIRVAIPRCGAYARSTGSPCKAKAMTNGRCKNHGGMSTGPKTQEGRQAIAQATRQRMTSEGRIRVLEGFYRWFEGGGARTLSRLAKVREFKKRQIQLMRSHSAGVKKP
jgi:hypothetical protein